MRTYSHFKKLHPSVIVVIGLSLFLFVSCGEDRIGEYEAVVAEKLKIEEKMREVYLWYKDMPEKGSVNYFLSPDNFFKKLLKSGDSFSDIDAWDEETMRNTSYGFGFELTPSTTSTKYYYARILYVLPDSPADKAGLKRGEWISKINEEQITKTNQNLLEQGEAIKLSIDKIEILPEDNTYTWIEDRTITMEAATELKETPILAEAIIETEKGNIVGYLCYHNFPTIPEGDLKNDSYIQELDNKFRKFKEENVEQFVLDLRYTKNIDILTYAQVLASLLAPKSDLGDIFCRVEFSDKRRDEDYTLELLTSFAGNNLDLNTLYVITGEKTAAASEFIFFGLEPYMKKILKVGQTTKGQYVIAEPYTVDGYDNMILYPAVATLYNSEEKTYNKGFVPDVPAKETVYINDLYQLGDPQEVLLKQVIKIIENNGVIPEEEEEEENEENEDNGNEKEETES